MDVRLLLKTHYQISKPGIFSVLIRHCTSPTQSIYPEVVSERLANIEFETIALNKEAAKFAVAMSQSFGFLTKNMFWGWKGQAINILLDETTREKPDDFLNLTSAEKILYLKYYLEADGAVILKICKQFVEKGKISRQELVSKESELIDQSFINIWENYRKLTTDLRQKVQLRENIKKLQSKPYTFKTKIHKALAHVEPLVDFDFIERKKNENEIIFFPKTIKNILPVEKLIQELCSIETMERRFSKLQHFEIISNIYDLNPIRYNPETHWDLLRQEILKTYLKAQTEPSRMASIAAVSDVISAKLLSEKRILIERPWIEKEMDRLKSIDPRGVHYHVDMSGKKAFVVLSDSFFENDTRPISQETVAAIG